MAQTSIRRLPVGIQSFKEIRKKNYAYVDKTAFVWKLVNEGYKFCYFSRPRRFGKSLLIDTLQTYLEGRKDFFEGLNIMQLEHDWVKHPVIRLDMSGAGADALSLRAYLENVFSIYEATYAIVPAKVTSLAVRFMNIILEAERQTGEQVAVLVDEYDSPLLHSWHTPEHEACTTIYREVFSILKMLDEKECFVFISGITKFTQISLFSSLNNLTNISFLPEYATLCGLTQEEISSNFPTHIKRLADANGWTVDEAVNQLKEYYDGYHFCGTNMTDVYNPYSVIYALERNQLRSYWAESGATTLIPKFVDGMELQMNDFSHCRIEKETLELSDVSSGRAEVFLYQSGYLTIKSSDEDSYFLGFPDTEVRTALYSLVTPALTMLSETRVRSLQSDLRRHLITGQTAQAITALKALIADVPYSNITLASMHMEERYRLLISTILNAIGLRVEVEHMMEDGRIDIVAEAQRFTYVMELKLTKNGGVNVATQQIREKRYLTPFCDGTRNVVGLAIELDDLGHGLVAYNAITLCPPLYQPL